MVSRKGQKQEFLDDIMYKEKFTTVDEWVLLKENISFFFIVVLELTRARQYFFHIQKTEATYIWIS